MPSPKSKPNRSRERRTALESELEAKSDRHTSGTRGAPLSGLRKINLQKGIIYGPVPSRRLGRSLGINLLPSNYKLCSFNCIYCQYGWTKRPTLSPSQQLKDLPQPDDVAMALDTALQRLSRDGQRVDSVTICGNGEPTLYPQITTVIEIAKKLRDLYQPHARLAILSNSSTVGRETIRKALELLDLKIMKFDAGSEEMFRQLNHPVAPIYMGEIVAGLKVLQNIFLQSLFVQGRVTNADPDSVGQWIGKIREIHPLGVQLYTLDRVPADHRIERVSRTTLQWIADQARWRAGVPAEIY
jgi:wyosine [tRNA(Phe)-imidazoG37] synthetase (radical SAM superfamily)